VRDAPAILATWFLGSEMGNAVADVLFGAVNPSARLPVSFPIDSGQEPFFYNGRTTGRPAPADPNGQEYKARWRSIRNDALYPFGFGLSYTRFDVSDMKLHAAAGLGRHAAHHRQGQEHRQVHGDHVVQLYIRDRVASRTRPVRELKGFQRSPWRPAPSREVRFELKRDQLMFVGDKDYWIVEPVCSMSGWPIRRWTGWRGASSCLGGDQSKAGPISLRLLQRDLEIEDRTLADRASHADLAAHQFDEFLADRQAQTRAVVRAGHGRIDL
jgi:hypothetical protein